MCEVSFEHENNINYMIIKGNAGQKDNYQVKMLRGNRINGLLEVDVRNINNERIYYYNIAARQRVTQFYEFNKIRWTDVKNICMSISEMVAGVNEYMLDTDCILLEPEYMFLDIAGKKVEFAYYPESSKDFSGMLRCLFEYILEHFDHSSDKNELMSVYEIYQKIVHGEYDPEKLSELYICDEGGASDKEEKAAEREKSRQQDNEYVENSERVEKNSENDYVIDAVEKEYVESESEKENKLIYVFRAARAAALLGALYTVGTMIIPQIRIVECGFLVSVVITAVLLLAYTRLSAFIKKGKLDGKVVRTREGYKFGLSEAELQAAQQEGKEAQSAKSNQPDALYDSAEIEKGGKREDNGNNERENNADNERENNGVEELAESTMLLSDYIKSSKIDEVQSCRLISSTKDQADIVIDELPCIIGSMKKRCTRVIENELVSRMHLCICSVTGGGYTLEDMNSTNGTYLNKERIMPGDRKILHNGDEINVGPLLYMVEIN